MSAKTPLRTKGWFAYERRKNKCFTDEELKQLSKLAESATRYSMRENDIKGKNKEEGPWVTHGPEN